MTDNGINKINRYAGYFASSGPNEKYKATLRSDNEGKMYFEVRDTKAPSSCGSDHGKIAEIYRKELTDRGITDPEEEFSAVFALGLANKQR